MDGHIPASVPPVAGIKCTTGIAPSASLMIGDRAPRIAVSEWLVGEPLAQLVPGKIHVVEFWASWCGPCQEIMPHLSGLQAKHPEVVFLSVAIWDENRTGPVDFIEALGDQVTHRVGMDQPMGQADESIPEHSGQMAREWMLAAGENSVPTAFLIDQKGLIAWVGHPAELDEVLPQLINGTLVVDTKKRERALALQRLELDPTVQVDAAMFLSLFDLKAPSLIDANLDWLKPEPKPVAGEPSEKPTGLFGRFMGRSKEKETPKPSAPAGLNLFGPPASGRPYGLILLPMIGSDGFTPGWESLDDPMINTLPQFFKQADFVAVVAGSEPIEELYEGDYRGQLADWGAELGWRMGFEISDQPEDETDLDGMGNRENQFDQLNYTSFWIDSFSQTELPLAAFVDGSGKILWVGSPLRLTEAVQRWTNGQLTTEWAAGDLVFWWRLLASAAANERMAGTHDARSFQGLNSEGPNLESDPAMVEVWEQTVESLNQQLPWRAHRWKVFAFRLATAKARQAKHSAELTGRLVDQFRKLTNEFEENSAVSPVYLGDWKSLIKSALDYMGLMANALQPLDSAALLALEGHPLTGLILDSVTRHDASIPEVALMVAFEPRLSPFVLFKFNSFDEAVAEQEKMIGMFDAYVKHQQEVMASGPIEDDPNITPEILTDSFLNMVLGEPPAQYRENLVKLRELYQKYAEQA